MWTTIRSSAFQYGLTLLMAGLVVQFGASALRTGSAMRMGPGYYPSLISWLLIVLGAGILFHSLIRPGEQAVGRWGLREIALVTGSIIFFMLALQQLGLLIAVFGLSTIASVADREANRREVFVVALLLSGGLALIFALALGLPIPLGPKFAF